MEVTIGSLGYTFEALAIGPPVVGTPSEVSDIIVSQYKDWLGGPPPSWQIDEDKEALILTLHKINSELKKKGGYVEKALARLLYYNQSISSQSSVSDSDVLKMMLSSLISDAALQNVQDVPMSTLPSNPDTLPTDTVYIVGVTIENAAHAVVMAYRKVEDNKEQEATGWIIFDPNGTKSPFALKLLEYFRNDKILSKIANIDNIHNKALSSNIFENGMGLARGMGWCQLFAAFTVMFLLQGRSVKTIEEFYGGKAFDYNEGSGQSNSDSESDDDGQPDSSLLFDVDPESFVMVALRQACVVFYRNLCEGIKDNTEVSDMWKRIFVPSPKSSVKGMANLKLYGFDVRIVPPDVDADRDAPIHFYFGHQKWNINHRLEPVQGKANAYVKFTFENRGNSQRNVYHVGLHLTSGFLYHPYFSDKSLSDCIAYKIKEVGIVDYDIGDTYSLDKFVLYARKDCNEDQYEIFRQRILPEGIEEVVVDCSQAIIERIEINLRRLYSVSPDDLNVLNMQDYFMTTDWEDEMDIDDLTIEDIKGKYERRFGDCSKLAKYGSSDPTQNPLLLYQRYKELQDAVRQGDLEESADTYDEEDFKELQKIRHWRELVFDFKGTEYTIKYRYNQYLSGFKRFALYSFLSIVEKTQEASYSAKLAIRDQNGREIKTIEFNRDLRSAFSKLFARDDSGSNSDDSGSDSDDSNAMDGMDPANILPEEEERKKRRLQFKIDSLFF